MKTYNFKMTEYILIRSIIKNGLPFFQVCKEGLLFLKQFRNKKLRIIFNVTHSELLLNDFSMNLLKNQQKGQEQQKLASLSQLRICSVTRQLNSNCVLICLNGYQQKNGINYVVMGYLISSVLFYHNYQELSEESSLTECLQKMNKYLGDTNIIKLQEQIKFKSGFSKKPYFMSVFHHEQERLDNIRQQFMNFYKYKQNNQKFNEAVDAITDYFPQRSAISVTKDEKQKIGKLGEQFVEVVLNKGRQILNFEITGNVIQNLCSELCWQYNNYSKNNKLNLLQIYNKIIKTQKMGVMDRSLNLYRQLYEGMQKDLPKPQLQMNKEHNKLQLHIIQQSLRDASNCMDMNEYQPILIQLYKYFNKYNRKLQEINNEHNINHITKLFEVIADNELQDISVTYPQQISHGFNIVKQKVQLFIDESIDNYTVKDLLTRLLSLGLDPLSQSIQAVVNRLNQQKEQSNSKLEEQQRQIQSLKYKNKKLQEEYLYMSQMNNQFKIKLSKQQFPQLQFRKSGSENTIKQIKDVLSLKKRIRDLEEEIQDKNITLQEYENILQKLESAFDKKSKTKFTKNATNLLSDVKNKINSFNSLFQELKKVQSYYHNIAKEFEEKKKCFSEEISKYKKDHLHSEAKLELVIREKKELQIIIQDQKKLVSELKQTIGVHQQTMNQLEGQYAVLRGRIGQTQQLLEHYKKGMSLIGTGKSEHIKNFIRTVEDQELLQMLNIIMKRI